MFKRMSIAIVALIINLPALASAKDMTGKLGLGYNLSDAPIGLRYWFSPSVGLDAGIGVQSTDGGSENTTDFWVEAGLPFVVYGTDQANLFFRLGAQAGFLDDTSSGPSTNQQTQLLVTFGPGAEVFFGDHFSLQAGYGIAVRYTTFEDDTIDSRTDFVTFGASVTDLGFHFYF